MNYSGTRIFPESGDRKADVQAGTRSRRKGRPEERRGGFGGEAQLVELELLQHFLVVFHQTSDKFLPCCNFEIYSNDSKKFLPFVFDMTGLFLLLYLFEIRSIFLREDRLLLGVKFTVGMNNFWPDKFSLKSDYSQASIVPLQVFLKF